MSISARAVFDILYQQIDKPLAVIAALDQPKILAKQSHFQYQSLFWPGFRQTS